jgi:hypothetical protein
MNRALAITLAILTLGAFSISPIGAQYPVWAPSSGTLFPGEVIPIFPPTAPPVRTISYPRGLTQLEFENRWEPVRELLAQQAAIRVQGVVPLPQPRPAREHEIDAPVEPRARRMARNNQDLCEKHGLRKVYSDRFRWRCK